MQQFQRQKASIYNLAMKTVQVMGTYLFRNCVINLGIIAKPFAAEPWTSVQTQTE